LPLAARGAGGKREPATTAQQDPSHREGRDGKQSNPERTDASLLVSGEQGPLDFKNSEPRKRESDSGPVTEITLVHVADRLGRRAPARREGAGSIQAAVALVLAPGEAARLELLLIKRAEHPGDPWSGQMALPGGRRQPEDQDLLATVARETLEEVGVALPLDRLLGELDDLHPRTPLLPPVVVRPFVFGLSHRPAICASREVALHLWVPLGELASGLARVEVGIPGRDQRYPGYRVGDHVVWGMTERIITPFIELLK